MHLIYTAANKERLDKFLHQHLPTLSRSQIQKAIKHQHVRVNGKLPSVHQWLKPGDEIVLPDDLESSSKEIESTTALIPNIVHQDDNLAVINKPAGLLIHPTDQEETHTLASWVKKVFPETAAVGDSLRPGIVHRLDKDVGGLVVIARNRETYDYLREQFQAHKIVEKYLCLVHGTLTLDEGRITTPIERNKKDGRMVAQSATGEGKEALTLFRVLKRLRNYTLLEVQIITGRTHQIRTHFYSIGHAVVGDPLYRTRDIRKRQHQTINLTKPFLFASELAFDDPQGNPVHCRLELPKALQTLLNQLTT